MGASSIPLVLPKATSFLAQPAFSFSTTNILVAGAVGTVAVFALSSYFRAQNPGEFPRRRVLGFHYFCARLYKKTTCKTVTYGLGAIALVVVSSYFRSFLKSSFPTSLAIRLIEQTPYSTVALIGIGILVGKKILTSFLIIEISFYPFKLSVRRNITFSEPPLEADSRSSSQGEIVKTEGKRLDSCAWPPIPIDILKIIFQKVLRNIDAKEAELNFGMFSNLSLVCKTWTGSLYHPTCLISTRDPLSRRDPHFLSKTFDKQEFDTAEIAAFFDTYLSPNQGWEFLSPREKFQGQGLSLSTLTCDVRVRANQLIYIMNKLPQISFEYLHLHWRVDDDAEKTGCALSLLLDGERVKYLTIEPDQKLKPIPPSLIGKILTKEERKQRDAYNGNYWKTATVPPTYSEKLIKLLEHTKGKVFSLKLRGGWDDPSQCTSAMKGLRVKNLYFSSMQGSGSGSDSIEEGEGLKQVSFYHVREGTMITNALKIAPHLKSLSIDQALEDSVENMRGENPLKGLSLKDVQVEKLRIGLLQANIEHSELKTILNSQTRLKDLKLGLPKFWLLPNTFAGLPIENLEFRCWNRACDESVFKQALCSIKATLKTLTLAGIDFTGSCLEGLQLNELTLYEVGGIDDEALRKALLGRRLPRLKLIDVDVTEACLEGLEIEELELRGKIPQLNKLDKHKQLYQTLLGLHQRGLKKLTFSRDLGFWKKTWDNSFLENFEYKDYYLEHLRDLFDNDGNFPGLEICLSW
jgi:hypothetical protein